MRKAAGMFVGFIGGMLVSGSIGGVSGAVCTIGVSLIVLSYGLYCSE